ncbi:MAG: efflux RND transporter permease subunit [Lachnospiraceae bacterium]|nr:efflux RND transporter permease subunit [Lachnospiraceae bacterium]
MKGLISGTLKRPVTVIITIIGLIIFAGFSLTSMPLKLMPDMSIPYIMVLSTYVGASPEEVDRLVTEPIESACGSISGLDFTQTQSMENAGYVVLAFEYGTDMDKAYEDVKVAIDSAKAVIPKEVDDPLIMEISMDSVPDMTISVEGTSDDIDVLQEVNNDIIPQLKKVSTVARVQTSGGKEKYIRVQLIPEYVNQYGLSMASVAGAITAVNFSTPAGTAYYGDQYLTMKSEAAYETVTELEQVPVTTSKGQVIHLSDIAIINYAVADATSISRYNGQETVVMSITRKQSDSAVTMSRDVMKTLEKLKTDRPELKMEVTYDSAENITDTLSSVGKTVAEAVLLAMVILFIFFGDIKASLIVGSTMPISILATFCLMDAAGFDLNVISLGALMIAVGMMTDNAVVVIEMCFRKLDAGLSYRDAAYTGAVTVMNSVAGSTITTAVVYLPISVMDGLSAQLFKPLGFTIIFALSASLISALTLIPLCFAFYKPTEKKQTPVNKGLNWLGVRYEKILRKVLSRKKLVLLISVIILVVTFSMTRFLKTELYSAPDEGQVNVSVTFRPNLSLEVKDREMKRLEEYATSDKDIKSYNVSIDSDSSSGSMSAYVVSGVKTQSVVDRWNDALTDFSDICEVTASVGSSMGGLSSDTTCSYMLGGTDLDTVRAESYRIEEIMKNTPGVLRTKNSLAESSSQIAVKIDPVMAQAKGFGAQQLAGLVYANMKGTDAAKVSNDSVTYTIKVKWPDDYFRTVTDVESMTFTNPSGVSVPLTEMAEIKLESAPDILYRQNGLCIAMIDATVPSSNADELKATLDEKIYSMELDKNVRFEEDQETTIMNDEFAALGKAIFIAIFLVFAVMAIQFESVASSLLIMLCLPYALIGSILLLLVLQLKISMVSLMGILMLSGIVVNNGIILIDMAIQNREAGMEIKEALVDAGTGRLRPILMTSLTTILAMVPTATGIPKGSETLQGMSVVIVGGLFASTILTLLLLPTFYLIIDTLKIRRGNGENKRRLGFRKKKALTASVPQIEAADDPAKISDTGDTDLLTETSDAENTLDTDLHPEDTDPEDTDIPADSSDTEDNDNPS